MKHSLGGGKVELAVVPMFSDNYGYIIIDKENDAVALVDPADPQPIMDALKEMKIIPTALFTTHYHNDHQGGNDAFKKAYPDMHIYGPSHEVIKVIDEKLDDGDTFAFGNCAVSVMHVPCHTKGHIAYYLENKEANVRILAPGDTLFVGGCGRFFEGTPEQMLSNMNRLSELPDDTVVCPAHEYTEANYKFLNAVDPQRCGEVYRQVCAARAEGKFTVPTTIGQEKATNLFMKCNDASVQALVTAYGAADTVGDAVKTMGSLREQKNSFK